MDKDKILEDAKKTLAVDLGRKLTAEEIERIETKVNSPITDIKAKDIEASAELVRRGIKLIKNDDGSVSVDRWVIWKEQKS